MEQSQNGVLEASVSTEKESVSSLVRGRADVGIKRLFLPCCIKGQFYANLTLLHKGKILCQPRLAVTARQAFMPSSLA